MTLNKLFETFVETKYGSVVTTAAIADAYKIFLGLPSDSGDFPESDARIAYWVEKNISAENFAEQFLIEAAQLNAKNAAAFGVTKEGRDAVVSAARKAADAGDDLEAIGQKVAAVAAEVDSQPGEGEQPGVPGESFMLTTGVDIIPAEGQDNSGDDTIEGVVSALSYENTFNTNDLINADAGKDTAKIALNGNFGGFTADGGMSGVENVELTNAGTNARTFDAKGVTDVEQYALNGLVSLTNLADTKASVSISNIAETAGVGIGFTADAVKGTADALNVGLNGLGTAAVTGTAPVAQKTVTVTANGIETLNINTTGDNFVALAGDAVKAINVAGAGSITTGVTATTKTFDASAATGNVDVNLVAATVVSSAKLGSGNDKLTVVADDDVTANATLDGGHGEDTLVIATNARAVVQFAQSGFETIQVNTTASNSLTYSGLKATGVNKLVATAAFAENALFANMGAGDMAVNLQGANSTTKILSSDHTGATTVVVDTPATAATVAAPSVNNAGVTATKSSSVNLNVAEKMDYQGVVTASKATSVNVAIEGQTTGLAEIAAGNAQSIVVSSVANNSDLKLSANKATDLNVTAAKDLTLTGSTLGGVQSLTVAADTNFTSTTVAMGALYVANLSGTGNIALGALGDTGMDYSMMVNASNVGNLTIASMETKDQSITLNAAEVVGTVRATGVINAGTGDVNVNINGTSGAVTLGGAITGKNVTIDATNALGGVTYNGQINVGNSFTLNGSSLHGNDLSTSKVVATGTSLTANIIGGLGDDKVVIDAAAAGTKITVTGDLDLEATVGTGNSVVINGGAGNDVVNASGLVVSSLDSARGFTFTDAAGGDDTVIGTAGNDTIAVGAGKNVVTGGKGADVISFTAGADADNFTTVVIGQGDTGITSSTADSITGFKTAFDKLKLGVAGAAANYDEATTAAADFDAVKTAADTAMNGTIKYYFGFDSADGYLLIDRDMDGTADEAVVLTGVKAAADFDFADIIA